MYFKLSKGIASLLTMFLGFITFSSEAENVKTANIVFSAQPAMCVALTQGRTCYANVKIEWSVEKPGDFCIVQKAPKQHLKCWTQTDGNVFSFEFQSNESVTYQLINPNNELIAETTIDVTWVHKKSPRKRRWRLF
jgi:hypothetical protein